MYLYECVCVFDCPAKYRFKFILYYFILFLNYPILH